MKTSRLDHFGSLDAPPGSEPWAKAITNRIKVEMTELTREAVHVGVWFRLASDHAAYKPLGFMSLDAWCIENFGITGQQAKDLLESNKGDTIVDIAAAIEAGSRKKTINIPIDPEAAARSIARHFTSEQIQALVTRLRDDNVR